MTCSHTFLPPITIRMADEKDAEALLAVYAPYVEHTAISFEYQVPTLKEFTRRISNIRARYPYLAACQNGKILGLSLIHI